MYKTEDKSDDSMDSFHGEPEHVYDQFTKHHMKIEWCSTCRFPHCFKEMKELFISSTECT